MKYFSTPRARAAFLLLGVMVIQLAFFVFVVQDFWALSLSTLALGALWCAVIIAMPKLTPMTGAGTSLRTMRREKWLVGLILVLAIFKLATRTDVYLASIVEGFTHARNIVDNKGLMGGSISSAFNVFLTPLWINLIALRANSQHQWTILSCSAVAIVPIITLLDMLLFGGRMTFAFVIVLLYVSGILRFRIAVIFGIFFVAAFVYVQATRSPDVYGLGFDYLSLTASGASLPHLRNLSAMGLPNWTVGPLIFGQYLAHSVNELINLIPVQQFWNPTFATIRDQLASIGFGDRAITQEMLAQISPDFGTYQTFFGAFLIDFGQMGIGIAIAAWLVILALLREIHGHPRNVMVLVSLSILSVASIENFFVVGGGLTNSILSVALAFLFSCRKVSH